MKRKGAAEQGQGGLNIARAREGHRAPRTSFRDCRARAPWRHCSACARRGRRPPRRHITSGHEIIRARPVRAGARVPRAARDYPRRGDRTRARPKPAGSPRPSTHDQRRRLLAADIAALALRGDERRHHTAREIALRMLECRGHCRADRGTLHEIGLHGEVRAGDIAMLANGVVARVRGDIAPRVDHADLTNVRVRIFRKQSGQGLRRCLSSAHQFKTARPIARLDKRLRRHPPRRRAPPTAPPSPPKTNAIARRRQADPSPDRARRWRMCAPTQRRFLRLRVHSEHDKQNRRRPRRPAC